MCAWIKYWTRVITIYVLTVGSVYVLTVGSVTATDLTGDLSDLSLSQNTLKSYLDAEDYTTALSAAERFVEIAEQVFHKGSFETAAPRHNLAIIQQELGMFVDAEDNYQDSIRIVEKTLGEYSSTLVIGLSQLGILHYQVGEFADALALFKRAQHITHRNDGVYTLDQLHLVDWISRINLATHETTKADIQQKFYYRINAENYTDADPQMIPALTKLGNWLRQSGQYQEALRVFGEIVEIMEIGDNHSQLALLPALRAISSTLYNQGICCPDEPLDRVLEITASSPTTDATDQLEAIIQLADMSLVKKKERKARKLYQRAWMMLGEDVNKSKKVENLFGSPTSLGINRADDVVEAYRKAVNISHDGQSTEYVTPSAGSDSFFETQKQSGRNLIGTPLPLCYSQVLDLVNKKSRKFLPNYYTNLDFSVDQYGKVQNVEIIDSNSPVRLNRYVINMLYSTRYRPRFENGEPVKTNHLNLHQTYTDANVKIEPDYSPVSSSTSTVNHGCQILAGK